MRCRHARSIMQEITAGTAAEKQLSMLYSHLVVCPRCTDLFNGLSETTAILNQLYSPKVSTAFDERFSYRLQATRLSFQHKEHGILRIQKRIAAVFKHFEWPWMLIAGVPFILFCRFPARFPKEMETSASFSNTNMLAMFAIMLIVPIIIRGLIESDFRLLRIFRRQL